MIVEPTGERAAAEAAGGGIHPNDPAFSIKRRSQDTQLGTAHAWRVITCGTRELPAFSQPSSRGAGRDGCGPALCTGRHP